MHILYMYSIYVYVHLSKWLPNISNVILGPSNSSLACLPLHTYIYIYINIVLGRHDIQAIHDIITATSTTTMTAHVYLFYHYLCFLYAAMPIYLILLIYCPNIQLPSSKYNHPGYIPNILRDSCPNHHHSSDVAVRWLIVKGLQLILLEVLL